MLQSSAGHPTVPSPPNQPKEMPVKESQETVHELDDPERYKCQFDVFKSSSSAREEPYYTDEDLLLAGMEEHRAIGKYSRANNMPNRSLPTDYNHIKTECGRLHAQKASIQDRVEKMKKTMGHARKAYSDAALKWKSTIESEGEVGQEWDAELVGIAEMGECILAGRVWDQFKILIGREMLVEKGVCEAYEKMCDEEVQARQILRTQSSDENSVYNIDGAKPSKQHSDFVSRVTIDQADPEMIEIDCPSGGGRVRINSLSGSYESDPGHCQFHYPAVTEAWPQQGVEVSVPESGGLQGHVIAGGVIISYSHNPRGRFPIIETANLYDREASLLMGTVSIQIRA